MGGKEISEKTGHILIVDDDPGVLIAARLALLPHFATVETLATPDGLEDVVAARQVDAVMLDMNFRPGANTGKDGLDWLDRLHRQDATLAIVLMTAYGGVSLAVEALKRGAADFVLKPWQNEKLIATMAAAVALTAARREAVQSDLRSAETGMRTGEMIGGAPALQRAWRLMQRAAPTQADILVVGEAGAGKEVAAREIHRLSRRASKPFVAANLDGLTDTQAEAELFGHRRGAHPQAHNDRAGKLQAADGGTLFLDDVVSLPMHVQRTLMQVIEQREVTPLGATRPVPIDVRIIAASHRTGDDLRSSGLVRADLLQRLRTLEIRLPPLRERREDVASLLEHFLALSARRHNVVRRRLTAELLRRLEAYEWPGNIRELRFAAERATLLAGDEKLGVEDFPFLLVRPADSGAFDFNLDAIEKQAIGQALVHFNGNITLAAEALGLTRPALYRRICKHGL